MVQAVCFVFIRKDNLQKNHPISEVIILLFTFQLLRDFVPLVKFDGNTEPVMVNVQGSDTKQMCVNNNIDTKRRKCHRRNNKFDTLVEDKIKLVLIKKPVLVCTAPLTLDFKWNYSTTLSLVTILS